MNDIVCISPVDGSVVARRRIATDPEIAEALAAARQAQREWSRVPLAEQKAKVLAFLEIIRAQNDEIVPEVAMRRGGRYVRRRAAQPGGTRPHSG